VTRILDRAFARGDLDLEALESAARDAALGRAAQALGRFMSAVGAAAPQTPVVCPKCGQRMQGTGQRSKSILTILGQANYARSRYQCPHCAAVCYPADELLDLSGTSRSPGVRRQLSRLGAKEPFHEVAEDLEELAGIKVSRKDAERIAEAIGEDVEQWDARERCKTRFAQTPPCDSPKTIEHLYIEMDGTGVPMTPWELQGRKGKQPDGSAKTREAKLGCVFTQTALNEQGRPMRDPASTIFTGAIEDCKAFGWRIYAQAVRAGLFAAKRVVVLADGAEWIRNLAEFHFPKATRIIDFYHALEHVGALSRALFMRPDAADQWRERWCGLLEQGKVETILEQAAARMPRDPRHNLDAWREYGYFDTNKECMRYQAFREQGLFVGSGVVEAGCKNVVGKRLKQSGMQWTVQGANSIIALRCASLSTRLTEYWNQRTA